MEVYWGSIRLMSHDTKSLGALTPRQAWMYSLGGIALDFN